MSRVMTLSKSKSIHGLPFALSVVSWTLLLVLLFSSSFSHVHRSGKQDAEKSNVGRNELARNSGYPDARSYGLDVHGSDFDGGRGISGDYRSSVQVAEASEQEWLNTKRGSDLEEGDEFADPSVVPEDISSTTGLSMVDALQYAEYGAGLLQKSGPAEESSRRIRLSSLKGSRDPVDQRAFREQECACSRWWGHLLCTDDSAQEVCQAVDRMRELAPGKSHRVCQRDTVAGTASAYSTCSPITQCRKTLTDSKFCHYDGSLLNLLPPNCERRRSSEQCGLTYSDSFIPRKTLEREDLRLDSEMSQVGILGAGNTLSDSVVDGNHDKAMDVYPQEDAVDPGDFEKHVLDEFIDTISPVTKENGNIAEKDGDPPSRKLNTKLDARTYKLEDDVQSSEKVYSESVRDSSIEGEMAQPANGMQWEPVKLRRVGSVMSLDEYRRSILEKQEKLGLDVNLNIVQSQKLRYSDESYNYAESSHGAKVLSSNREAKGASHIISSDKDKYLRNPCSADKYVVLELSEETFVDTVVIANFEFHSANLKDFEVFGSPVYPAKEWILLGKFRAENVRHRQKFSVEDPKLVRYLKLKMLTHWGSEFFCTLSAVEVYGVDVIKNLLDDWIAQEDGENVPRMQMYGSAIQHEENASESFQTLAGSSNAASVVLSSHSAVDLATRVDAGSPDMTENKIDGSSRREEPKAADTGSEIHYAAIGGKTPGDSVLKILMQKVKGLESSRSLFDDYLEDMNTKYKAMLSELDKDLILMTERIQSEAAFSASLAVRLAELEVKRREERAYMEHEFALIAVNFTENIQYMRWQIHGMEKREVTAMILALICLILSGLLHLISSCLARRVLPQKCTLQAVGEDTGDTMNACSMSAVSTRSSSAILYLASGLTILVLTV